MRWTSGRPAGDHAILRARCAPWCERLTVSEREMKVTMAIPSYWGRSKGEGWQEGDAVYDHPTPLDEDGTLRRALESLSILENKDFNLVVLAVATADEIQEAVEDKVSSIVRGVASDVETLVFSHSHLARLQERLEAEGMAKLNGLLALRGYSNIRNLCVLLPHILGSDVAILIDDDEIFEEPSFMDKAVEFIGREIDGRRVLAVAGYYVNPDGDYLLNGEVLPWMTEWNKIGCMNRAFEAVIATEPRLQETPFVFGGNMVVHRDLFTQIPFDPAVTRGEDIDFLMNARMFGYAFYLDKQLSIKHAPPPKSHPKWKQLREDIYRFVFEKAKIDSQKDVPGMTRLRAEDLDPYPGEFLRDDLQERIFRSNQMLAVEYLLEGDSEGARECMRNIYLAKYDAPPSADPFEDLLAVRNGWKKIMAYLSEVSKARELRRLIWG